MGPLQHRVCCCNTARRLMWGQWRCMHQHMLDQRTVRYGYEALVLWVLWGIEITDGFVG
jgi:hypothetical protein